MKNYRRSTSFLRCVLPAGFLFLAGGFSANAYAANSSDKPPAPIAATVEGEVVETFVKHTQSKRLTPAQLAPHEYPSDRHRIDYNDPVRMRAAQHRSMRMSVGAPAAGCEVADFATASGAALVDLVKSVSITTCLNDLYDLNGTDGGLVFPEAKMVTIANAIAAEAVSYPGDNSTQMLQLITFLRAGYYVQYTYPNGVGSYGTSLKNAIRPALAAFIASPHFSDVSSDHGQILNEFLTLIDSAEENAAHLDTLKGILDRYDASYDGISNMRRAANNVFTVLYLGHYRTGFAAAAQADPSIIDSLADFIRRNTSKADTANEYLVLNAGNEMARFMQYPSLLTKIRPLVKEVLDTFALTGPGAAIYSGVANMALWYDKPNCAFYGICNFVEELEASVLPITHVCGPSITIRAQALTPAQLQDSCDQMLAEDPYFHAVTRTNEVPVANDNNTRLEVVVFDSSAEYKKYAGTLFGINTNNGGMYLEGTPSNVNNLPRFIAHRAEWLPEFEVWNLLHEYVHYLDGRFNMWGDFSASISAPTIWWTEGLAEYVSYGFRNKTFDSAVTAAGTLEHPLSTIFYNDYNSGTARVYYWGYLAVRYMFERHPGQVDNLLSLTRTGKYSDYATYQASIRHSHDADWTTWLTCFNANGGDTSTCGGAEVDPAMDVVLTNDVALGGRSGEATGTQVYKLTVPNKATSLVLRTMGGTGNVSLYLKKDGTPTTTDFSHKSVRPGNNESITIAKPAAGVYHLLVVGETAYSGVTVHGRYKTEPLPPSLAECTNTDMRIFNANCQRSGLADTRNATFYPKFYYYSVPANTKQIIIESMGGTGNADLYAGPTWASTTAYEHKSTGADNNEQIVVNNPPAGLLYFSLVAVENYENVQLRLTVVPNTP